MMSNMGKCHREQSRQRDQRCSETCQESDILIFLFRSEMALPEDIYQTLTRDLLLTAKTYNEELTRFRESFLGRAVHLLVEVAIFLGACYVWQSVCIGALMWTVVNALLLFGSMFVPSVSKSVALIYRNPSIAAYIASFRFSNPPPY